MRALKNALYPLLPIPAQNAMLSVLGARRARRRYGPSFRNALRFLSESEWWSAKQLERYQEDRLQQVVQHAYHHVPYYRDLMRAHGLTPEAVGTLDGLQHLPVLTKADVQNHAERLRPLNDVGPVVTSHTSGSTGTSLHVQVDARTEAMRWATVWRHRARFGLAPKDRYVSFSGDDIIPAHQATPPFWREDHGEHRRLFSTWHLSDETLPHLIDAYNAFTPAYLQGYPSALYAFAEFALRTGRPLIRPNVVLTSSETLLPHQRTTIERAFQAPVSDLYGSGEQVAMITQCERGSYHVDAEFGLVEIIDGRLVATSLHNTAMPLLRYVVGDGLAWKDEPCPCGRALPVVEPPSGRVDDVVTTPSGRRYGRLDHLFKDTEAILEAQLVQRHPDRLTVNVVPRGGHALDTEALRRRIATRFENELAIDLVVMNQIPRNAAGKFRFVVSHH